MKISWSGYESIINYSLDEIVSRRITEGSPIAVGSRNGIQRAQVGVFKLHEASILVANDLGITPTINYEDFTQHRFQINEFGLSIPRKTDRSFKNLLLFHNGGEFESGYVRNFIIPILQKEAGDLIENLILQECNDQNTMNII